MPTDPHSVGEILDCLDRLSSEQDEVYAEDLVYAFGTRSFGPMIMVPALIELTPIGAILGVPTFLALVIATVALQKMIGGTHLWLPGFVARRHVSSHRLAAATSRLRPLGRFLDRHFHGRLEMLTRTPFSQLAAGVVLLLCACVPFLEVLPFASSGPMLAIAMFGLAVLVRDGALMIVALGISLGALGLGLDLWHGGFDDSR